MIEDEDIAERIAEALRKQRGYADFYSWPDRDLAEFGVTRSFVESASGEPGAPFSAVQSRGRGADPPDCEAIDAANRRIGIEVTELVDSSAIKIARQQKSYVAQWDQTKTLRMLTDALRKKDSVTLKDPPYHEYFVVIFTGEYLLSFDTVSQWLRDHKFFRPRQITRAYLLLSYEPTHQRDPLIRLRWL